MLHTQGLALCLVLALLTPGCQKLQQLLSAPAWSPSDNHSVYSLTLGLLNQNGRLKICTEIIGKATPASHLTDGSDLRSRVAWIVRTSAMTWAQAAKRNTPAQVDPWIAETGGCPPGDLNAGHLAVHLIANERLWQKRLSEDRIVETPGLSTYINLNDGIMVIAAHRIAPDSSGFTDLIDRKVGLAFGLTEGKKNEIEAVAQAFASKMSIDKYCTTNGGDLQSVPDGQPSPHIRLSINNHTVVTCIFPQSEK